MFTSKAKKPESITPTIPAAIIPERATLLETDVITAIPKTGSQNVIAKGTIIQGNIIAEGDLLVEGTVRGDVTTKTTLIIGPTCVIEGNILAEHAEVAGQVKGTVQALGLLIIKSSSMIDGDVLTKNLNVESGSTFNGRFTVGSVTSTPTKKAEAATMKMDTTILANDIHRPIPAPTAVLSKI